MSRSLITSHATFRSLNQSAKNLDSHRYRVIIYKIYTRAKWPSELALREFRNGKYLVVIWKNIAQRCEKEIPRKE